MPYLIIDLEMTGPDPEFHDFIQIGAILANNKWEIIGEYNSLVYPDNEDAYSVYAEEVHGLSIHDLYEAPTSYEVIEDLEQWVLEKIHGKVRKHLRSVVVAGHSVYNDISFLRAKYFKHNYSWPFAYRLLDLTNFSYIIYRVFRNNGLDFPKSYSLETIANYFGIERQGDEHDALEDARITYLCFKNFFEILDQLKVEPTEPEQQPDDQETEQPND